MTRAMYMSKLYAPTLKEDPADAELASHRLLLRAGMIRKEAAGLTSSLPPTGSTEQRRPPVYIPTCRLLGARFARSRTSCATRWTPPAPRSL